MFVILPLIIMSEKTLKIIWLFIHTTHFKKKHLEKKKCKQIIFIY